MSNTIELTEQQTNKVIVASLKQALQLALTPVGKSTDHDLVDSIKQVLGLYMTLEEHKALMQDAAVYELAQAAMQAGDAIINSGASDD